jgi:hypothetical protein
MASPYWQKVKDKDFAEVPDTYLDFLLGLGWFVKSQWSKAVEKELATRKRSHYHVEDQYGKRIE